MTRMFEDRPAVREATPLLVGLIGPSGSGKTFSALRLATGIQKVSGGDIYAIDTESRRMLHYADKFKFRHLPFGAPFGPLDYLAATSHCIAKGAKTIIVDSMSHEHEGPGGVLEQHELETKRLAALWKTTEQKAQIAAWAKPKQERRRFINTILQLPANFIFCFRAKEKLKIVKGKEPEELGFMPQAGEEFVYEMVLKCLLLPGANGRPTWQSEYPGEKLMIKIPEQFRGLFADGPQLTEEIGQKLAEWAAGVPGSTPANPTELLGRYVACSDPATLRALEEERKACWSSCTRDMKAQLKGAYESAAKRIADAEASKAEDAEPTDEDLASQEEIDPGFGGTVQGRIVP
jgi:energy-coupling factor transporter ATP-binding protein EcfA2